MSTDRVRRYELKARAERRRQTRERIVAATESLHREVGPARTTIADIARRAGVERLTVYNHFPELKELLQACQGRFLAASPPPSLGPPLELEDALVQLYRWYRSTQDMQSHVQRDRHLVPELDALLRAGSDPLFDKTARAYAAALAPEEPARRNARRLVRLALDFWTWRRLAEGGATDEEAAGLLAAAAGCAAC